MCTDLSTTETNRVENKRVGKSLRSYALQAKPVPGYYMDHARKRKLENRKNGDAGRRASDVTRRDDGSNTLVFY
jgi:hypothetical protein